MVGEESDGKQFDVLHSLESHGTAEGGFQQQLLVHTF